MGGQGKSSWAGRPRAADDSLSRQTFHTSRAGWWGVLSINRDGDKDHLRSESSIESL